MGTSIKGKTNLSPPQAGDAVPVDRSSADGYVALGTAAGKNVPASGNAASGEVVQGNDTRLTDARTPTSHTTSHKHGGSDEVATATPAANAIPKAGGTGKLANGWLNTGTGSGLDADTVDGQHASAFDAAGAAASAQSAAEATAAAALSAHAGVTSGVHGITAAGAALIDDASAAAQRTTLGLGTAATSNTGDFEAAGAVAAHEADTTSVHGIADTSALLDTGDIGSTVAAEGHTHTLSDVTDAGTAAALNVPAAGDAASGEVVKGNDSRLTDARTPTSHNHAGEDVTSGTVAAARLGEMTGDSGAGGAKGAVPAPGAGDAAASKFLKADGTWAAPGGGIGGSTGATDNAILRADGTGGATAQGSTVYVTDGTNPIIQLGGATSSYPGLARSGVAGNEAVFVSADGGAEANVRADQVKLSGATVVLRSGGIGGQLEIDNNSGVSLQNIARTEMRWLNAAVLVEANTAGSGAPNVLTAAESGTLFTNEGATAKNYHTLPSAAAGYQFEFVCQDADGIRITAATGDTIRVIDKVTASAGYIETTTIGSVVRLVAINATEWVAMSIHGTWTDGTFTYDDTGNTTP